MALQIEPGASGGIHTRTSIDPHAAGDVLSLICMDSAVNEYVWCFTIQHRSGLDSTPARHFTTRPGTPNPFLRRACGKHASPYSRFPCAIASFREAASVLVPVTNSGYAIRCVRFHGADYCAVGNREAPILTNTSHHSRRCNLAYRIPKMLLRVSPGLPPGRRTSAVAVSSSGIGKPKESSAFTRADHAMNREMAGENKKPRLCIPQACTLVMTEHRPG